MANPGRETDEPDVETHGGQGRRKGRKGDEGSGDADVLRAEESESDREKPEEEAEPGTKNGGKENPESLPGHRRRFRDGGVIKARPQGLPRDSHHSDIELSGKG
jgi:hypothetical protein